MLYYQGNPTSESTSRLHLILVFAKIKYPILFPPPPHSSPLFCPLDIIRNKIGVPRVFRVLFRVSNILSSLAKTKLGSLSPAFLSRISVRFFFWGVASQPRSFSLLRQRAFQPEPWLFSHWSHSLSSTAHLPSEIGCPTSWARASRELWFPGKDPSVNTTYTLQYCSIIYSEDKVPSFLCPVGETYTPTSFRASQKKNQNWYLEVRPHLDISHVQTLTANTINLVYYVG